MARLVLLSGPSCVGKGPLAEALRRHHPQLAAPLVPLVLHNSRAPRPGEADGVDYHFRPRHEIEQLADSDGFVACDVRGDLQALELATIDRILESGSDAFFEGNPFVPHLLRQEGVLDRYPALTVFLSPLSRDEIVYLSDPGRRDLANIEARASSAITELGYAHNFDHVIPNHDGEDSENWDAFYYPVGDAFKTLAAFAALLAGEVPDGVERWDESVVAAAT